MKTLAIRESGLGIIQKRVSNIIIESDPWISIQTIKGHIKVPSQILNLIEDINVLAKAMENINVLYCSKSVNNLADRTKKPHYCSIKTVFTMNEMFL